MQLLSKHLFLIGPISIGDLFSPKLLLNAYWVPVGYFSYRLISWIVAYIRLARIVNKIKGIPMIPIAGNLLQVPNNRVDRIIALNKIAQGFDNEPFFRFWTGAQAQIIFHRADFLEALLSSSKNVDKSWFYMFMKPWLNEGLLTSDGEKWFTRRRLITPTFHFEILYDFMQVMNEQAQILVEILGELHEAGEPFEAFRRMSACTLDIICETAMGQNVNAQRNTESNYVNAVRDITLKIIERANKPYFWPDFPYYWTKAGRVFKEKLKIVHGFTRNVIKERHAEFEHSNLKSQKRIAFLDMLLKAKAEDPSITFDDIQEEVDTFMFEGHDTTAAALTWALQMIGSYPDVQKKLHEEIDQVFGSSDRQLKSEDLGELKYLECVIKETLRLYPSVPFYSRQINEDQVIAGHLIPAGVTASVFAYALHRDQRYFPEPEKFIPERFTPENSVSRHPFAYVPFSAGKRNCIGQRFAMMEEKIVLANILRRFELKSLAKTEDVKASSELILRPAKDTLIEIHPRMNPSTYDSTMNSN